MYFNEVTKLIRENIFKEENSLQIKQLIYYRF